MTKQQPDTYSDAETVRRREAALKKMLSTPHRPHSESAPIRKKKPATKRRSKKTKGR